MVYLLDTKVQQMDQLLYKCNSSRKKLRKYLTKLYIYSLFYSRFCPFIKFQIPCCWSGKYFIYQNYEFQSSAGRQALGCWAWARHGGHERIGKQQVGEVQMIDTILSVLCFFLLCPTAVTYFTSPIPACTGTMIGMHSRPTYTDC